MLERLSQFLIDLAQKVFGGLVDLLRDAFKWIVDQVLGAIATLLSFIGLPAFATDGLAALWAQLDPGILYLATSAGLPQALLMIGSAYAVRLVRKVVTLFQW